MAGLVGSVAPGAATARTILPSIQGRLSTAALSFGGINGTGTGATQRRAQQRQNTQRLEGIRELLTHTRDLGARIDHVRAALSSARLTRSRGSVAQITSTSAPSLNTEPTYTTLRSGEEVNTTTTSFSPRGPGWDGPQSTTEPTVSGTYDGSLGDQTIEFRVHRDRTVGGNKNVRLNMYDESGSYLGRVLWTKNTPPDTEESTGFGLNISLSAGEVERNESFFVDVSASQGTDVDPDAAFDGIRNDHPELEDSANIVDGSFTVNGQTIDVGASDSLNDVLGAINASGAGVTATYDSATDSVLFTQDTAGDEDIVLADDTSGFLAALKLDSPDQYQGVDPDPERIISEVAAFAGVTSGTITINGTDIAVDVDSDSLQDVLGRISASGAGVSAEWSDSGGIILTGAARGVDIAIEADSTGLLAANNIALQTEEAKGGRGPNQQTVRDLTRELGSLATELSEALGSLDQESAAASDVGNARNLLLGALQTALEDFSSGDTGLGMVFELGNVASDEAVWDFDSMQVQDLAEALRRQPGRVAEFLLGENGEGGLLDQLDEALGTARRDLMDRYGHTGLLLSRVA